MESSMTHLHVDLTDEEHETLSKLRGDKIWKIWLLSIPATLREAADAVEKAELREKLALRDLEDLEERCTRLQRDNRKCEESGRKQNEKIIELERRIDENR